MNMTKQKATLFVDGDFLRKEIQNRGEQYIPQNVLRFLTHGVHKIHSIYPNLELSVFYYGSRPNQDILYPISQQPLDEIDMKKTLSRIYQLPEAKLRTFWGRMARGADHAWIMKPEGYLKSKEMLTDEDFMLNVPRKGVLTKMVDTIAEKAIIGEDERLFVWGDESELKYAFNVTEGLDMPVDQLKLTDKDIVLSSFTTHNESSIFKKDSVRKVVNSWRHMGDVSIEELLPKIRSVTDEKDSLLMVDAGVIRKFLKRNRRAVTRKNVQEVLDVLVSALPENTPTQAIFYHAYLPTKSFINPKSKKGLQEFERDFDLDVIRELGMHMSMGQMYQSEECPFVLKQDKWFVPNALRDEKDFEINVHQHDVDDRIVYDMAMARFSPKIRTIYLLATDSDFVYSVQKAQEAGIKVVVLQLGESTNQMSMQLRGVADDCIKIDDAEKGLSTRVMEKIAQHEQCEQSRKEQLRQEKQAKRRLRVVEEDIDDLYPISFARETKKEKMGQQRAKYRKAQYNRIMASHHRDKKHDWTR